MSGKISGFNNAQSPAAATATAGQRPVTPASQAPGGASGAGTATDSVQITDKASSLAAIEQTLSEVPVISSSRVAETSEALANGTYRISPQRIANQLLSFERLLPDDETVA